MLEYPKRFIATRMNLILAINKKREEYRVILSEHLKKKDSELLNPKDLNFLTKFAFLLSSSRSGSSITASILSQHAKRYKNSGNILLCLQGELKPYFDLSQLSPPFVDVYSNELDVYHTKDQAKVNTLLTELSSEIGYPIGETTDILEFSIIIYGRLLLQWPILDFGAAETAVSKIYEIVKSISLNINGIPTYVDTSNTRILLLKAIKKIFPEIDLSFYDIPRTKISLLKSACLYNLDSFIEEPPFIIPVPWHFAIKEELAQGILFLKDPSNSWRIPFWREILRNHTISWLHLTRNVLESVNGLCNGWIYPFGFITNRSPKPLKIRGYTQDTLNYTQWYTNFSTSNRIWELLLHEKSVDLEQVCSTQWADAHRAIINLVSEDKNYFKISSRDNPKQFGFEWLRAKPVEVITQISEKLDIELTQSLIDAANDINNQNVQVTQGINRHPDRWKVAENRDLIIKYSREAEILEISQKLGY